MKSKYLDMEDATLLVFSAKSAAEEEEEVSLPLPVRLQDVYNDKAAESETWPSYVYDVRVPAPEVLERNLPTETYPTEDSRLCTFTDDSWTLYKGINTLHYDTKGLQGTTGDGSNISITKDATQVALEEGVVLNINKDGTLTLTHVEERDEASWTILHGGAVIKSDFISGGKVVMLPDGCIGRYDASTETWTRVNSKGGQWKERLATQAEGESLEDAEAAEGEPEAPEADADASAEAPAEEAAEEATEEATDKEELPTLSIARVRDPDTGSYVSTREDLTMMIQYEEGHQLSLFYDGTRMITYASGFWETMLQMKNVSLLIKGTKDTISVGKLVVEKDPSVRIKMPFDTATLEVSQGEEAASVSLGGFGVDLTSGTLTLEDADLWSIAKEEDPAMAEATPEEGADEGADPEAAEAPPAEDKAEEDKADAENDAEEAPAEGQPGPEGEAPAEAETEAPAPEASPVFKARVFKVYKGGEAVEFIDEDTFETIKAKAEARGDQHISETDIHNSETQSVPISHTFLSESDVSTSKGVVVAFNIAGESQAPRALQTLTVPSAITFAYVGTHSVPLPMISAIPSDAEDHSKILLVRQVQEFPRVEDKELASVREVMADLKEFDLVNEETSPSTYMVSAPTTDIQAQINSTAEKIKRLRMTKTQPKDAPNDDSSSGTESKASGGHSARLNKEVM